MKAWPLVIALLLAGCGSVPPRTADVDAQPAWEARQLALARQSEWTLNGRLSLTLDETSWHASLRWRQRGDDYEIRIFGPFGRAVALIEGGPDDVLLRTAEGEEFRATDADELLRRELGWPLPVAGLRYWVLGLAQPPLARARVELADGGRPLRLFQDGWTIDYQRYSEPPAAGLPDRMLLTRETVSLRLLVDEWRLPDV